MNSEHRAPILFGIIGLMVWQSAVIFIDVPAYVLTGPVACIAAVFGWWATKLFFLWVFWGGWKLG
jgi:ABC-type nitrate/sulfonate/bicarbonate transport system permease component